MAIDFSGPGHTRGRRMLNIGITALLARKGINTEANSKGPSGAPIHYIFRRVGQDQSNISFRYQPAWQSIKGEEPNYMKLRNYTFNVFKETWGSVGTRNRPGEEEGARKARRVWAGPSNHPGAYMQSYNIKGDVGAKQLMDKQKFWYKQGGMDIEFKILTRQMIRSFIAIASSADTWRETITKEGKYRPDRLGKFPAGEFGGYGGGIGKLGFGKTKTGGLPIIGAESSEEAIFYIMNNQIEAALAGKEFDVNTGIMIAGRAANIRPAGQKLDVHKDKQKIAFEKTVDYFMKAQMEGRLVWANEKEAAGWETAISGFDVSRQHLLGRFPNEWKIYKKKQQIKKLKDWSEIRGFLLFIRKRAEKFTLEDAPRGAAAKKAGMPGQFARRGEELAHPRKFKTGAKTSSKAYIYTVPYGKDRMVLLVRMVKMPDPKNKSSEITVPIITPGYMPNSVNDLGSSLLTSLLGEATARPIIQEIEAISGKGYATWDNTSMQITYSTAEQVLYMGENRFGDFTVTATMVTRGVAARALSDFVKAGALQWFETVKWDNLIHPNKMTSKFGLWFRYWIERSRQVELKVDKQSGTQGWKNWLRNYVTPKYVRGDGGRPPKTRSRETMPYAPEVRTWHPPLYARPFIQMNKSGLKAVADMERRKREVDAG